MSSPAGPVIIVTGASSGIGEAVVRRLARSGMRLVISARRADRLEALARTIDPDGAKILAVASDVTIEADRTALVAKALQRFGKIDALINNAGYGHRGPVELVSSESLKRNYEVNVFAVVALTQKVIPHFREQGRGRIVNISSVAGKIARPLSSIYDSTKHALEALSDGLRGELAPFGIQVVVVRPGFISTEFGAAATQASADTLAHLGPYQPYMADFDKSHAHFRRLAGPPDVIAKVVEKALTSRHPKTHYAAPGHAKAFLFAKWILSSRLLDRFVRMKRGSVS